MRILLIIVLIGTHCYAFFYNSRQLAELTTINFLWINKDKPKAIDGNFIIPEPYIRQILPRDPSAVEYVYSFNRIMLWAKLNPKNQIKIWYDSTTVGTDATEASLKKFKELGIAGQIELIDINDKLKDYKILFNNELPIYYRVDIVRILAAYTTLKEKLERGDISFFAYFDLSIDPIKLEHLYAYHNTTDNLNNFGIVTGKTDQTSYENSFFVMGNNKPNLLTAILGAMINKNIVRVSMNKRNNTKPEEQQVYSDFVGMMHLFHALEGRATISLKIYDETPYFSTEVKSLKKLSPDELKNYTQIKNLRPGQTNLFNYNDDDINNYSFEYNSLDELKAEFKGKNEYYQIPTRPCISKTSKLSN